MAEQAQTLKLDYRVIVGILLVVIAAMLAVWRPWEGVTGANQRTVTVTGEATVKATPDQYSFYPSYRFSNADKAAAVAAATERVNQVVAGVKALGVKDSAIKTSVDGYKDVVLESNNGDYTYSASVTITLTDKDLAQKVQGYLVTTSPEGSVTSQPTFSETTGKQLESQARDTATKDARSKADQSARNLGFRVGAVKSVTDGAGFGGVMPMLARDTSVSSSEKTLTIQPGENELSYSVTVEYYIH